MLQEVFLIDAGSKLDKAKELEVSIWDEKRLLKELSE